jgi:hypothetical protein
MAQGVDPEFKPQYCKKKKKKKENPIRSATLYPSLSELSQIQ